MHPVHYDANERRVVRRVIKNEMLLGTYRSHQQAGHQIDGITSLAGSIKLPWLNQL